MTIQQFLLPRLFVLAFACFHGSAFAPSASRTSQTPWKLHANVATSFILREFEKEQNALNAAANKNTLQNAVPMKASSEQSAKNGDKSPKKLSRPERKALERAKKGQPQRNAKKQRGNNKKYELNSQAISSLSIESTADDVLRAIKRAQNLHDAQDLKTIEKFLLEEVDEDFGYGYRGSLLSRLAVAALHMNNHELARRAMDVRKVVYRPSMLPLESAAIIRGLLRVDNVTDALQVLDDELSLPLEVSWRCTRH
jgi:hypothetical protein